jgi:glycosyltransferase involved in cell wall biosynthesis
VTQEEGDPVDGGTDSQQRLRIGIVAPPLVPIPPKGYAGTERIVAALAIGLHERGHQVTVFAAGDSDLPCEVVPVVPRAVWARGLTGDDSAYFAMSVALAWEQASRFDVIHSHVEHAGFLMARHCGTPVVTTLHRRLDTGGIAQLIDRMPDVPLIAISDSQRRWNPDANWIATIHHGLDFRHTPSTTTPGEYLLLVGRLSREKGVEEAIEVARRSGRRLVMAMKEAREPEELEMFPRTVQPAIDEGVVDWRGEVDGEERDRLMAGAFATLMLGGWPEPFGLVAIESMATGTPVIGRRAGALMEILDHGATGFLVDDVDEAVLAVERIPAIRRDRVAAYARGRFSAERMTSLYEQAFASLVGRRDAQRADVAPVADLVRARQSRERDGQAPRRTSPLAASAAARRPAG